MPQSYTLEQLQAIGAKPKSYTLEELTAMGAKPAKQQPAIDPAGHQSPLYPGGESSRTATQVMQDQAANVLTGIPEVVTGIPGAVAGGGQALLDMILGRGSGKATEMLAGTVTPFAPVAQTLIGNPPSPEDPAWKEAAQGAGAMLAGAELPNVLKPIVKAGMGAATAMRTGTKTALAGGKAPLIEQAILRGAGSKEAHAITARISPELARDGELVRAAATGSKQVDTVLLKRYEGAKQLLNIAEKTVPGGTTIEKAGLLAEIKAAMDELRVPAAETQRNVPVTTPGKGVTGFKTETVSQSVSGYPDALKTLKEAYDEVNKFPDDVPFENLRKYRQQLDNSIQNHSGWKETASAADQAAMVAKRKVVNIIRNSQRGISAALDAANKAYSLASDSVNAAGIDTEIGRRLSTVGKPTGAQKAATAAKKGLLKGAAVAGGGAALYGAYEKLKQ